METEEDSDEREAFHAVPLSNFGREKSFHAAIRYDEKGVCSNCSTPDRLSKKLIALSYDCLKPNKICSSRSDHSCWNLFTVDCNGSKSAYCLSALAKTVLQKPPLPNKNQNVPSKVAAQQNGLARRRRLSEPGGRRGKTDEVPQSQFVFQANLKKYIETFRREKLLALQKHLFEDEIKAKFEEIAATLAVRRSFLDDLPETSESLGDAPNSSSNGHFRRDENIMPERTITRSQTAIIPLSSVTSDGPNSKLNLSGVPLTQQGGSAQKTMSHINLDLPSNNQSLVAYQEVQLKAVDTSRRGLLIYQKPIAPPSGTGPVIAQGNQIFSPSAAKQQMTSQLPQAASKTTGSKTSVAKVFDVASFILDRDLLKRKVAEQLRSPENNMTNSTVKPLGRVSQEIKPDITSSPATPMLTGSGKSFSHANPSIPVNSPVEGASSSQPGRLMTAADGGRAHISGDKSNTTDSVISSAHQRSTDPNFSDIKYWLMMSVGGRNAGVSQNSGAMGSGQANLAAILKQQANELKSLQRQASSNASSNDAATIPIKLKTFNAAEAIPPSAKPAKPKHWSLTAGGQRLLLGAVNISARGDENAVIYNGNNISNKPILVNANENNSFNIMQSVAGISATDISANIIPPTSATMAVPSAVTTATHNPLRLFSASNSVARAALASESLPSAAVIVNNVSFIGSAMHNASSKERFDSKQHLSNILADAINRRSRYQNPKRPPSRTVRKSSASRGDSNNGTVSVALRLTMPSDLANFKSPVARSLSTVAMAMDDNAIVNSRADEHPI